jgi:hypothetical protein
VNRTLLAFGTLLFLLFVCHSLRPRCSAAPQQSSRDPRYPAHWWTPAPEAGKPEWEILPQEAGPGEVILSKRNELGLLSNFAPTPFTFRGKRYASLEGFWQMMLYPEGENEALYKVQPSSFVGPAVASFWPFLLFSFNAIIHAAFATLTPKTGWAILLANLETLASVIIGVIFFFVLLTSNRERYRQDVKTVVDNLREGAEQIAGFIQNEFKVTMIEAEAQIVEANPDFAKTLTSFGRTPTASQLKSDGAPPISSKNEASEADSSSEEREKVVEG